MHHLVQNQPNLVMVNQAQFLKSIKYQAHDPCFFTWACELFFTKKKKKKKEPIQMFRLIEKLPFKKSNFYLVTPEEILTHLHMINETYLIA